MTNATLSPVMFKGLYVDQPGQVVVREMAAPELGPYQVRIRTTLAAIKHGTTFHAFSGTSPFHDRRFDKEVRLFVAKEPSAKNHEMLHTFVGSMVTGSVSEVGAGVHKFKAGDRVFCYGPVCDLVTKNEGSVEHLAPPMSDSDALCLDPALFAYGAVRDANICVGDNVTVFGLGAIGLFVVQLLKLGGCLNIVAIDPIEKRRRFAEEFGATATLDPSGADVGLKVREIMRGVGADVAIEASGSYPALNDAMRSVRQCGRVVTVGYYRGKAAALDLAAEWLHNRLEMICSLPDWGNPAREYPVWDRERMWRTLIALFQRKSLTSHGILDPIVKLEKAPDTFMRIYRNVEPSIKMGVRFCG